MEKAEIYLSNADRFDAMLKENRNENLPECGDLELITKDGGMLSGLPIAMLTFTVMDGDKRRRVQAVTSCRMLQAFGAAIHGRYGEL